MFSLVFIPSPLIRNPRSFLTLPYILPDLRRRRPSLPKEAGVRLKSGEAKPPPIQSQGAKAPVAQTSLFARMTGIGSKVDYDVLRAQAVDTGDDEAVTVNPRDLIDKIMSRCAREWSTL